MEEQMVEDLLLPSPTTWQNTPPPRFPLSRQVSYPKPSYTCHSAIAPSYTCAAKACSLFTSTDPFYIAQLQAAQNYTPSFFSQAGHPTQHSPFLIHHEHPHYSLLQYGESHGYMQESGIPVCYAGHPVFIGPLAAFEPAGGPSPLLPFVDISTSHSFSCRRNSNIILCPIGVPATHQHHVQKRNTMPSTPDSLRSRSAHNLRTPLGYIRVLQSLVTRLVENDKRSCSSKVILEMFGFLGFFLRLANKTQSCNFKHSQRRLVRSLQVTSHLV
jgi:hypothetical protein